MRQGSIELLVLGIFFVALQIWWIKNIIKNGRTEDINKWGQREILKGDNEIDINKKRLEKIYRL